MKLKTSLLKGKIITFHYFTVIILIITFVSLIFIKPIMLLAILKLDFHENAIKKISSSVCKIVIFIFFTILIHFLVMSLFYAIHSKSAARSQRKKTTACKCNYYGFCKRNQYFPRMLFKFPFWRLFLISLEFQHICQKNMKNVLRQTVWFSLRGFLIRKFAIFEDRLLFPAWFALRLFEFTPLVFIFICFCCFYDFKLPSIKSAYGASFKIFTRIEVQHVALLLPIFKFVEKQWKVQRTTTAKKELKNDTLFFSLHG